MCYVCLAVRGNNSIVIIIKAVVWCAMQCMDRGQQLTIALRYRKVHSRVSAETGVCGVRRVRQIERFRLWCMVVARRGCRRLPVLLAITINQSHLRKNIDMKLYILSEHCWLTRRIIATFVNFCYAFGARTLPLISRHDVINCKKIIVKTRSVPQG